VTSEATGRTEPEPPRTLAAALADRAARAHIPRERTGPLLLFGAGTHTACLIPDGHSDPPVIAGRPIEAMALIGLGYRSISMSAASIGPVKAMVLELDAQKLESYVLEWLETGNQAIRARLQDFAEANNIPLG